MTALLDRSTPSQKDVPTQNGVEVAPGRPLSVMMLGLRGCQRTGLRGLGLDVQGGVERHVEELAPRLAALGARIEVLARAPYVAGQDPRIWRGVLVTPLPSPRSRSWESIVHTARGVIYAAKVRPDLLHIHAVGPALLAPAARLLGLRVVVTHHGFDYERAKWGALARLALRAGEAMGMRFATARIGVSQAVAARMLRRYGVPIAAIPNGVGRERAPPTSTALRGFGLERGRYVVLVARLVPEKRHLDLIEAFARAAPLGWRLALVGAADHADDYSRRVAEAGRTVPAVVTTGFQSGTALRELVAHAGLFVLPSSHEGLPIALLEALAVGVPALASDIAANREVGLADDRYFAVGDIDRLAALIGRHCRERPLPDECETMRARVLERYDWDHVAARTLAVYRSAVA